MGHLPAYVKGPRCTALWYPYVYSALSNVPLHHIYMSCPQNCTSTRTASPPTRTLSSSTHPRFVLPCNLLPSNLVFLEAPTVRAACGYITHRAYPCMTSLLRVRRYIAMSCEGTLT